MFVVRRHLKHLGAENLNTSRSTPLNDPRMYPTLDHWRHLAIVLDNSTGTWMAYLDGEMMRGDHSDQEGVLTGVNQVRAARTACL